MRVRIGRQGAQAREVGLEALGIGRMEHQALVSEELGVATSLNTWRRSSEYRSRTDCGAVPAMTAPSASESTSESIMPETRPKPLVGLVAWAASPASSRRPTRRLEATRWCIL